jgi:hypothetical protein
MMKLGWVDRNMYHLMEDIGVEGRPILKFIMKT